ncbi:MAG: PorT family protein [Saprospiraceae bacterium]|nr:PorT family protein [Saprospiraceae bacterium]
MKNLLNFLVVYLLITTCTDLYSQTFGIKAGLNHSKVFAKDKLGNYSEDAMWKTGFHVGAIAECKLHRLWSLETGLLLSTKGYKYMLEDTIFGDFVKSKNTTNLYYIDIPFIFKVGYTVKNTKFYTGLGPYFGFGIYGNVKGELTYLGQTETFDEPITWGSDEEDDYVRRFDFGLAMGIGLELKSIQIGLSYHQGLANISSYRKDGATIRNSVLGLSLAYRFIKQEERSLSH